jgi:hypothetical protein
VSFIGARNELSAASVLERTMSRTSASKKPYFSKYASMFGGPQLPAEMLPTKTGRFVMRARSASSRVVARSE